jgi:hypothetical protein
LAEGIVGYQRFDGIGEGALDELCHAFGQSFSSLLAPPSVGQYSAGNAVEPQASFVAVRHLIDTPPRNEHRVSDDVGGIGGRGRSTQSVGQEGAGIYGEDRSKAIFR